MEEIRCYVRDKEVNSQIYSKLCTRGKLLFSLERHAAGGMLAVFVKENSLVVVNGHVEACEGVCRHYTVHTKQLSRKHQHHCVIGGIFSISYTD